MMEQDRSSDDIAAAKLHLAVYGADIERWPARARARWGNLVTDALLARQRGGAAALDALLDVATPPQTPHDLKNRIEAGFYPYTQDDARGRDLWNGIHALSGWLRPAPTSAFAGLAGFGFILAALIESSAGLPPEYEAYVYLEDSDFAALDTEAEALWDAE